MSDNMRNLIDIITESSDLKYDREGSSKAKTAAGDYSKITATVTGKMSEKFTKLAKKFAEIDELNKQMQDIRDEANAESKQHVEDLFTAEDATLTRYIKTKSLVISMSKDQEQTSVETSEFNAEGFVAELYELLDDEMQPVIEKLLEVHTKTTTKVRAAQSGRLSVRPVKIGESTMVGKLSAFMSKLLSKVKSRMQRYDSKLDAITSKYAA